MSEIRNRSAYHEYYIEDKYDAGMVLMGTEVKSIREGKVSFVDSFCFFQKGELWVRNLHIAEYRFGTTNNHIAVHDRKLLLNKKGNLLFVANISRCARDQHFHRASDLVINLFIILIA